MKMSMTTNRSRIVLLVAAVAAGATGAFRSAPSLPPRCRSRATATSLSLFGLFRRQKNEKRPRTPPEDPAEELGESETQNSRRSFFMSATASAASITTASLPVRASAADDKQKNLSDAKLKEIILSDIVEKSFLVSADITRAVYDESATFTDEIDIYTMDKWIKGTKSLFIPSGSRVSLVGDVAVSAAEVSFRFDEDLMFNM